MKVVDEYIALRLLDPQWESSLLDERLVLPYSRHWRLLSALSAPSQTQGQLSRRLQSLSPDAIDFIRRPHPDVLHIPDPRDHALLAADLLQTTGASSLHSGQLALRQPMCPGGQHVRQFLERVVVAVQPSVASRTAG